MVPHRLPSVTLFTEIVAVGIYSVVHIVKWGTNHDTRVALLRVCASTDPFGGFGPLSLDAEIDQRVRSQFHGPREFYESWNV